jgi:hypothetical protein
MLKAGFESAFNDDKNFPTVQQGGVAKGLP